MRKSPDELLQKEDKTPRPYDMGETWFLRTISRTSPKDGRFEGSCSQPFWSSSSISSSSSKDNEKNTSTTTRGRKWRQAGRKDEAEGEAK